MMEAEQLACEDAEQPAAAPMSHEQLDDDPTAASVGGGEDAAAASVGGGEQDEESAPMDGGEDPAPGSGSSDSSSSSEEDSDDEQERMMEVIHAMFEQRHGRAPSETEAQLFLQQMMLFQQQQNQGFQGPDSSQYMTPEQVPAQDDAAAGAAAQAVALAESDYEASVVKELGVNGFAPLPPLTPTYSERLADMVQLDVVAGASNRGGPRWGMQWDDEDDHVDGPRGTSRVCMPNGLAVHPRGGVLLTDAHCVRHIDEQLVLRTVAGGGETGTTEGEADGIGAAARFCTPRGIVTPPEGWPNWLSVAVVADGDNCRIAEVHLGTGSTRTLAMLPCRPRYAAFAGDGALYIACRDQ